MARTDRAAFARNLIDAEGKMDALFRQLAIDVGNLVLRAQDADGTVPIERLAGLQREVGRLVDAIFVGTSGKPFDEAGEPAAAYPAIIAEGQRAMIRLALERTAKILDKNLPEDVRRELAVRRVVK